MKKLLVIVNFKDKETLVRHFVDEVIERTESRAKELINKGVAKEIDEAKEVKPKKKK